VTDGDNQVVENLPTADPEQEQRKLDDIVNMMKRSDADLARIRPPQEIKDLHDEYVSASEAFVDEFQNVVEGGAGTDEVFSRLAQGTTVRRLQDACLALRRYGLDRGIDLDLECLA